MQDGNVSRVFYLAKGDRFSEFKVIDDVKNSTYSPVPITESQQIAKKIGIRLIARFSRTWLNHGSIKHTTDNH